MEVHHHSHTPRKKWAHYFWEFFMLFFAVFCGMLAEYRLEHIIEHQREKKYIRSLITDVELDITSQPWFVSVKNKTPRCVFPRIGTNTT